MTLQTIRIAVTGSVDASKSTLIGVLKTGLLDNGNGIRRLDIKGLKHEQETGRTSYINDVDIPSTNTHPIHLIDLAGHEKYLKTTLNGLTNYFPDYAFVVINANAISNRIDKITTEHIVICKTLLIPMIFVITKIDIAPQHLIQETYKHLIILLRKVGYNIFYDITTLDSIVNISSKFMQSPFSVAPMLSLSNVTGIGLPLLKEVISTLIPRQQNKHR
jgi:GTPase